MSATSDPLGQSQYPPEAVEVTFTFLVAVTDDNRPEVDGPLCDVLDGLPATAAVAYWPEKHGHYVDNRMVATFHYERPPRWKRPKPPRQRGRPS